MSHISDPKGDRVLDVPRPLTPRERDVLDALLHVHLPGVEQLRDSVESLLVHVEWDCCPSIQFVRAFREHWPVVDASTDDFSRDVILFVDSDGAPYCLQLVFGEGDAELPAAASLTVNTVGP
ncbi:hypothetical protein [Actinotalea sp. Marseille-Q4924]|uniref:hypothetical protein n=1 Tax=Actinotalea sp. Marseille-Q4924 TaxID=2866571 RepID=UPI001CE42802|nr:hypothetical protein [Actinotalea sp. Marseille-Q4924]